MTGRTDDTASRKAAERELLARLGLTEDANTQMIEAAHDDLVQFLDSAPSDLRTWAQRAIAAADEAFALLLDPTEGLTPEVVASITTAAAVGATAAPAGATAPRASAAALAPAVVDDDIEELSDEPVPVRPARSSTRAAATTTAPVDNSVRNRLLTRLALVGGGILVVAVLVVAVYSFGGGGSGVPGFSGTPAPEASPSGPVIDQAQVAALMQKLQANPSDTATLLALGNLYYNGADYATAGTFFDKLIAIDPKNVQALLGRGATAYNVGDRTVAEKDWRAAIAADPKNVDAHYYLGFMYLDSASPDLAQVKAEWNKVIELAPGTSLATTVQQHLTSLASGSFAPGASGAPAGSAAPAASPSPSAQ